MKSIWLFLIPLAIITASLSGDEAVITSEAQPQTQVQTGPAIRAQFFTSDAVQALPRLKALRNIDPETNKIIFSLDNFPVDQEIFFEIRRMGSKTPNEYEQKCSFTIDKEGLLHITGSDHTMRVLPVGSRGYLPGEKVYFRFRTEDGSIDKEVWGVPTPALIKDKDGNVVINAEMVSLLPTVYKIDLPQIADQESFELKATSVGEIVKSRPNYNKSKGFLYSPAAKGISKGGDAVLEIKQKNGKTYSIKLPWGAILDSYILGKKVYTANP